MRRRPAPTTDVSPVSATSRATSDAISRTVDTAAHCRIIFAYRNQNKMECAACYMPTTGSVVPCGHLLCHACAQRWLAIRPTCPVCRSVVVMVRPHTSRGSSKFLVLTHGHAGVTLANAPAGVAVTRVNPRDMAWKSGLRRGDVLTHMNGVPLKTHENAVKIIERARALGTVLECTLASTKRVPLRARLVRLFRGRNLLIV